MARSNIPMVINLRQNKNDDSTAYGKFFAEVDSKEPLSLKGFAKHMRLSDVCVGAGAGGRVHE